MTTYVYADTVPENNLYISLTPGKRYELERDGNKSGYIRDDYNEKRFVYLPMCAFLHGEAWKVEESE